MKYIWLLCMMVSWLQAYRLGIETMPNELIDRLVTNQTPIGVVTNHTGCTQQGERTIDVLRQKQLNVQSIFVPEHGLKGNVPAGQTVDNSNDEITGLPVKSLYAHGAGKKISPDLFAQIDTLIFDMQDVGMRHFTYISTLYTVLEAAAQQNKEVIVLDRPNPLGAAMEGPLCDQSLRSFVGIAPIPLRHGLTIGELAQWFNKHMLKDATRLLVVKLQDFSRKDTMNTLVQGLSPNLPSVKAAQGYSFLGLLGEVQPFNVGLGSKKPFQLIALPAHCGVQYKEWRVLQQALLQHNIRTKPYTYVHKQKRMQYSGLQVMFDDIHTAAAFKAFVTVLDWAKERNIALTFSPLFDKAMGTRAVREWALGDGNKDDILKQVKTDLQLFLEQTQEVLLYDVAPHLVRRLLDDSAFKLYHRDALSFSMT